MNLTLLSDEEIFGDNSLDVIKRYGTKCAVTDLAILTGAFVSEEYHIEEDTSLTGRTGYYWTRSDDGDNNVRVVSKRGNRHYCYRYYRCEVIRPTLSSSVIFSTISPNRVIGYNGTEEVAYGEYPQMAADERMQDILEIEYPNGLIKTGRSYTFDSRISYDHGFSATTYEEYEYEGKKYIRVKANSDFSRGIFKLSNKVIYVNGDYVWVEVSPVIWLIDEPTGMLISKKGLVSGIRYLSEDKEYKGDFDSTEMKEYLDKYLSKELQIENTLERLIEEDKNKTEEEILEELIAATDRVKRSLKLI